MCLPAAATRELSNGDELSVEGKTTDGRSSSITYSLRGYRGAIQEMNERCDNTDGTPWLIRPLIVDPDVKGTMPARFDAWRIGIDTTSDKKRCFIYTVATSVAPDDWRDVRPMIYISVTSGSAGASHSLDTGKLYDRNARLTAVVSRRGSNATVPVLIDANDSLIKMNEVCTQDKSKMCVSRIALRAITDGDELVLSGKTASNQTSRISYALRGYKSAIQEMNKLCDNSKATEWLIQEGRR
jgi:hypothetical protein